jgi:cell division septation protein DedD
MSTELAAVTPIPAPEPEPTILLAAVETTSETGGGHALTELALLPSDERVPESEEIAIAEESLLSPIAPPEYEYTFIDAIQPTGGGLTTEPMVRPAPMSTAERTATPTTAPAVTPAAAASPIFSPFQAPLITQLEANKWYIQIAAYTRSNYVEDEITRIGREYPLAIQNVGSDTSPMFRVLLGPMNQGESGAVLQRIKSIGYKDAFVRHN